LCPPHGIRLISSSEFPVWGETFATAVIHIVVVVDGAALGVVNPEVVVGVVGCVLGWSMQESGRAARVTTWAWSMTGWGDVGQGLELEGSAGGVGFSCREGEGGGGNGKRDHNKGA